MLFSRPYFFIAKVFIVITIFTILMKQQVNGQTPELWNEADPSLVLNDAVRYSTPASFRTVELNIASMRSLLSSAPKENLTGKSGSDVIITIPMPNGSMSDFRIWETPVMAPGLAAQYPNIKTYIAEGVNDHRAIARFDVTNFGFHAMILSPRGDVFIDPVSNGDNIHYISYFKKDLPREHDFDCGVLQEGSVDEFETISRAHSGTAHKSSGTELRTYRLALACTGEYAATKGGTISGALSGMVTSINRVSGIYEQEVGVRFELIDNDTLLIFLNSSTDGYTNFDGFAMLDENQAKCDAVIGSPNYDIGHVFSTGGGGIAMLGCVCRNNQKAMGVTGLPDPVGDAFDVDYVAHEIGHQYGANHTFNCITSSCGGGNRSALTAFEPGSASTIMGYAGICGTTNDLQPHSDPFFHVGNFDEITDYTILDFGNDCPVITQTGNNPPVITVGANYSIPLSTPFRLDASATDADGDSLAYMFDEIDNGPSGDWNNPSGNAPLFRSWKADTLAHRYFPKISTIVNNYPPSAKGEVLADYARTIEFRFIARDHRAGGGGVTYNDNAITLTVVNTINPFKVTTPNTLLLWPINTESEVLWDVSSTNLPPINCQNVNILLSIDGGYTYPIVLASNTLNDGTEAVLMPNDLSLIGVTTARVMVQSAGNVFFDISDNNFMITVATGTSSIGNISPQVHVYPNPANDLLHIVVNGLSNESVSIALHDVIGRKLFEKTESNAIGEKSFDLDLTSRADGIYTVEIKTDHGNFTTRVVKQ